MASCGQAAAIDETVSVGAVGPGREAFERRAWDEAYVVLRELDAASALDAADLERLAVVAYLVGDEQLSERAWERAHRADEAAGRHADAARSAVWLGVTFFLRGETAHAGGWFARVERLANAADENSVARGFALIATNLQALMAGDMDTARTLAVEMIELAHRLGDRDLLAWGLMCEGEVSIALSDVRHGVQLLDEAMLCVATGELSPIPAGIIYCAAIDACLAAFDLRRAGEWTDALATWCTSQTGLVPFRGQCLVHRSQLLQARGAWTDAAAEAERASRLLSTPPSPALGLARYQEGELHRLRGNLAEADRAYRAAAAHGHDPAPGLALLRLAVGDVSAAVTVIGRMLEEHRDVRLRPLVLGAAVEILLAAGQRDAARIAVAELDGKASAAGPPLLGAIASHAGGRLQLTCDDAGEALAHLRRACRTYRELHLPYDAARAEVDIAAACLILGDTESADLALDAAHDTFTRLGARPDLARVEQLRARQGTRRPGALTVRELDVLRQVAAGKTNREIADALMISPHTVGRHLQNIFMKLGLSSRAAATAYAYEHDLT